jgi:hypothetical protein
MTKRILLSVLLAAFLCTGFVPQAMAAGLDEACRAAQLSVQSQVGDVTSYANHGMLMKAVAHAANVFLDSGEIDDECHSCIVSQYARRVAVADQTPCGPDAPSAPNPECSGADCSTFLPCNIPNSCSSPVCVTTADGLGACIEGDTGCSGLSLCPGGTGDCPAGYICAVNTCCGDPVCIPPSAFCEAGAAAPFSAAQPVTTGPTISNPNR